MRGLWWLPLLLLGQAGAWAEEGGTVPAAEPPVSGAWSRLRDQGLAGSLRLDYYRSSKSFDNASDFLGATAQLKLLPTVTRWLDAKIEGRTTNPDVGNDGDTQSTLIEGYVTAHFEHADLRVGKQIVVWGRADGINPTDNLTPHDYQVMLPFEEDQRLGTTAIKLDAYLSADYTLTLFATPYFLPSKLPFPADGATLVESRPDRRWSDSEAGLRLNRVGGSLDWSVSYFHGYNLLPEVHPLGVTPTGPLLELRYTPIDVLGADLAQNFGRYGVRAEVAYIHPQDYQENKPIGINPYLYLVAGMDRTFLDNLNLNLQLVSRWVQDYTDSASIADPLQRDLAEQNAITFGQQDRANYGMTTRISNKWFNDTLTAEVLAFVNFKHANSYIRPLVTYAFSDFVKATVGAEWYRGADNTFFGRVKRNQGAFAEVRYSF
jgi:hypothetical protein